MPNSKKKLQHATVIGVFASRTEAEAALRDLRAAGFTEEQIGLVARNASGEMVNETGETYADEGAVAGAVAGAGIGTLVGLGILAGVVPVIGPAIVAGTLGTILTNAVGGAAVIGLTGALVGWGIPEEDATWYESEVTAGRYLVTVDAGDRKDEAWAIIHRHGGYDKAHAPAATSATAAADYKVTGPARRTMQLKEEQLNVTKTPVTKGEVEVRKEVVTEHKQITVPVEREEVVIERRPVRGKATTADLHAEQIRIPVKEEKVTVTKEAVVTEEVTVGKRKVQDTETVDGTVRKEKLKVEEEGDVDVTGNTEVRSTKSRK